MLVLPFSTERIVSVQVTTQVNNSTDSCNVTLSCSVFGSHQVALFWSINGGNIPGTENKTTLTVSPTLAEEIYTCTAKNPVSSQSSSVTVKTCQPRGTPNSLYIYIPAGVGGLLLVVMVIIALVCILKRSKRGEEQADITVYAEIGEHTLAKKDSMYSQPPVPADVTTCYDVIKPTGNPAAPSTVYAVVNRPTAQQYQEVL
ncbi:signaling lymphocytic activation molecule-like [Conger conger]|uniref:signaling lymphocytic activation molecule-like n=1 Tax=Conger conger TaxID=82655 RepID=UPI002A5AA30D|nr:signaling lymphocytic activation molecule-like [Conger conger]